MSHDYYCYLVRMFSTIRDDEFAPVKIFRTYDETPVKFRLSTITPMIIAPATVSRVVPLRAFFAIACKETINHIDQLGELSPVEYRQTREMVV